MVEGCSVLLGCGGECGLRKEVIGMRKGLWDILDLLARKQGEEEKMVADGGRL